MTVKFRNDEDVKSFVRLATRYEGGAVKIGDIEINDTSLQFVTNLGFDNEVSIDVDNVDSTVGIEFIGDLMDLGILEDDDAYIRNGWIG